MPNQYGFHVLGPGRRCIECDWPGDNDTPVSESDQRKHHATHERARKRDAARARDKNLALARKTKKMIAKEVVDG